MRYTTIGKAFKLKSGIGLSAKKMISGDYPVFGGNGINGTHNEYMFKDEKIAIGRVGAYCGNVHKTEPKAWITDNALFIHEFFEKYDTNYLVMLLRNLNLNKYASQSGQPLISAGRLKDVQIPLPPLDQQKKIADILDAADVYKQKTKALIEKYDELTQSLFLDMFGDPVTNPKGWEIVKFHEVGKLDRGKSKHRPRNAPELLGGEHPLIQTGDIANCGIFLTTYKSTYSDIGLKQSKKWHSGTLCITIAANIAKTGILTFDACFPDSVVGFIPNEKTNNIYALFWLSFLQKILEETAPESAQKNINLAILRALDFTLPKVDLQNQFAERVQAIEEQKAQAQASLAQAEDLFNSLLQRAFKGELTN